MLTWLGRGMCAVSALHLTINLTKLGLTLKPIHYSAWKFNSIIYINFIYIVVLCISLFIIQYLSDISLFF